MRPALPHAAILSFRHPRSVARDNTVKYRWRTLQLLPGPERTSYAGMRVEVVETADRRALRPAPGGDDPLARGAAAREGTGAPRSELARILEPRAHRLRARSAPRRLPALLPPRPGRCPAHAEEHGVARQLADWADALAERLVRMHFEGKNGDRFTLVPYLATKTADGDWRTVGGLNALAYIEKRAPGALCGSNRPSCRARWGRASPRSPASLEALTAAYRDAGSDASSEPGTDAPTPARGAPGSWPKAARCRSNRR